MGMFIEELQRYFPVADAIAKTFGHHCEVTVHDLSAPQASILYAVNSHVTGSEVGQPLHHSLTRMLFSRKMTNDVVANFRWETEDKRAIKATAVLLRDAKGEAIGALCICVDIEQAAGFQQLLAELVRIDTDAADKATDGEEVSAGERTEEVGPVWEIVDQMIAQLIAARNVEDIDKAGKLHIVSAMDKKGLFLIKGAMEKVAAELNISKVTLYSYLDEIRSQEQPE